MSLDGPYLFPNVPEELQGLDQELIIKLHDLLLRQGEEHPQSAQVRCLWVQEIGPVGIYASTTTVPGQLRVMVSTVRGGISAEAGGCSVLFSKSGNKYVAWEYGVEVGSVRTLVAYLEAIDALGV